eukprot:scaffold9411_cov59-Phaeocystis_antarctica.AAC.3
MSSPGAERTHRERATRVSLPPPAVLWTAAAPKIHPGHPRPPLALLCARHQRLACCCSLPVIPPRPIVVVVVFGLSPDVRLVRVHLDALGALGHVGSSYPEPHVDERARQAAEEAAVQLHLGQRTTAYGSGRAYQLNRRRGRRSHQLVYGGRVHHARRHSDAALRSDRPVSRPCSDEAGGRGRG